MQRLIINRSSLEIWQEIDSDGWRALVNDIIDTFFEIGPTQYITLKEAWSESNFKEVKSIAHSLKSSCGNVGAEEAQHILNEIELSCSKEEHDKLSGLFKRLEVVFVETTKQLVDFKKVNQAA